MISISTKPTAKQVEQVLAAGPGCTVHHPLAGLPGRRRQLAQALTRAGAPHRVVRSLGWSATGPSLKAQKDAMSSLVEVDLRAREIEPSAVYWMVKSGLGDALREAMPFAEVEQLDDGKVQVSWDAMDGQLLELVTDPGS